MSITDEFKIRTGDKHFAAEKALAENDIEPACRMLEFVYGKDAREQFFRNLQNMTKPSNANENSRYLEFSEHHEGDKTSTSLSSVLGGAAGHDLLNEVYGKDGQLLDSNCIYHSQFTREEVFQNLRNQHKAVDD